MPKKKQEESKEVVTVIWAGDLLAHLPPELTKYKDGRLRLSPSRLGTFDGCKSSFRNLILGDAPEKNTIYSLVGKAAHTVMEKINTGWKAAPIEREELFKMELIRLCEETDTPLSFPGSYKETKETLRNYNIPSNWKVFSIESKQVLRFRDFDFSYIADGIFIEIDPDGIEWIVIVDYKTNAQVPKSPAQLKHYYWATIHRHPELKGKRFKMAYHMLRKDKMVYYEISPEVFDELEAQMTTKVGAILQMVKLDYFPTEPSMDACRWCPLDSCGDRARNTRDDDGADEIMKGFGR